jgi:hypothetical protein
MEFYSADIEMVLSGWNTLSKPNTRCTDKSHDVPGPTEDRQKAMGHLNQRSNKLSSQKSRESGLEYSFSVEKRSDM